VADSASRDVTRLPAGVNVIDTSTWRVQPIDPRGSRAIIVAGTLLLVDLIAARPRE
jgi:hypothetical protein